MKNKITVVGKVGNLPDELKKSGDTSILEFSVAENYYKPSSNPNADKSENYKTQWHNIVMFGTRADYAFKNLSTGADVVVMGHLQIDDYTNKEGEKRKSIKVNAEDISIFSGGSRERSNGGNQGSIDTAPPNINQGEDDDLPF